jgi:hypothetical protein
MPHLGINASFLSCTSVGEIVLNRALRYLQVTTVLAAVAITVAGCASSIDTAQTEQPYKTAFGMTSDGPTGDLYTEFFGPHGNNQQNAAMAAPAAVPPPSQPATATATPQQMQPTTRTAANRQPVTVAPEYRRGQVAQGQPISTPAEVGPPPAPPAEPGTPTAYGISSNGTTTDLYSVFFGPKRRDGQ